MLTIELIKEKQDELKKEQEKYSDKIKSLQEQIDLLESQRITPQDCLHQYIEIEVEEHGEVICMLVDEVSTTGDLYKFTGKKLTLNYEIDKCAVKCEKFGEITFHKLTDFHKVSLHDFGYWTRKIWHIKSYIQFWMVDE